MNDSNSPKPKRRWYRFTPDRFIVGLLAVEVFLLLSERFCWFPFNERKGYTVLVAVAALCVGILVLLLSSAVSLLLRRPFQFGIRSLLVLVLVVAVPCSWLAVKMQQARKQKEAVEGIEKELGAAIYDYENAPRSTGRRAPHGHPRLRKALGDDFFSDVVTVHLSYASDAGLEHLKGMTRLRKLYLNSTQVTDAGLEHLEGLTSLEFLFLRYTQVTDAGLKHLKGLTNLEELWLGETQVTDEGVKDLQEALPRCEIHH